MEVHQGAVGLLDLTGLRLLIVCGSYNILNHHEEHFAWGVPRQASCL